MFNVPESQLRRRRSLISAQGWSFAPTLGINPLKNTCNAESVGVVLDKQVCNAFSVATPWSRWFPQGCQQGSDPELKLANAFGVTLPSGLMAHLA